MAEVVLTPVILASVFSALATVSVGMRFYSRHIKRQPYMLDDWMILPALLFTVGHALSVLINTYAGGLGQHQPMDRDGMVKNSSRLVTFQLIQYFSLLTCVIALTLTKLSVLHFYARIFTVGLFRHFIRLTYAINIAWGLSFLFGYIFKCVPVQKFWTTSNGQGHCLPQTFNFAFAWSNVILDAHVLVMPLPIVWLLNMKTRQKWYVTGIFCLGAVVLVISSAKALAFQDVGITIQHKHDITFYEAPLFYYSVPETSLSIVSACLPTFRPLLSKLSLAIINAPLDTSFPLGPDTEALALASRSRVAGASSATLQRSRSVVTPPQTALPSPARTTSHIQGQRDFLVSIDTVGTSRKSSAVSSVSSTRVEWPVRMDVVGSGRKVSASPQTSSRRTGWPIRIASLKFSESGNTVTRVSSKRGGWPISPLSGYPLGAIRPDQEHILRNQRSCPNMFGAKGIRISGKEPVPSTQGYADPE